VSVIVNVDGSLEEFISRYSSDQDRGKLQRATVNLIEKEWDINILEEELADVKIKKPSGWMWIVPSTFMQALIHSAPTGNCLFP